MGNLKSKGYKNNLQADNNLYNKLYTDKYILVNTIDDLNLKINNNAIIISNLEQQLLKMQKQLNNTIEHYNTVENNLNMKINIINTDMESLLNNDKLLLDKMIEKHMLSTVDDVYNLKDIE